MGALTDQVGNTFWRVEGAETVKPLFCVQYAFDRGIDFGASASGRGDDGAFGVVILASGRGEEGAFYLLFPGMSEEAGELKCAVIGDQIARLLSSEDPIFFELEIVNTVGMVDRKNLKNAMAEKSAADIRRRLLDAREKNRWNRPSPTPPHGRK